MSILKDSFGRDDKEESDLPDQGAEALEAKLAIASVNAWSSVLTEALAARGFKTLVVRVDAYGFNSYTMTGQVIPGLDGKRLCWVGEKDDSRIPSYLKTELGLSAVGYGERNTLVVAVKELARKLGMEQQCKARSVEAQKSVLASQELRQTSKARVDSRPPTMG